MGLGDLVKYAKMRFNKRVRIFRYYQNSLAVNDAVGCYQKETTQTPDGREERRVLYVMVGHRKLLFLRFGGTVIRIPAPNLSNYYVVDDADTLDLFQYDINTFFPMITHDGKVNVLMDRDTTEQEVDEKNQPVFNKDGSPKMKVETVEQTLFDSSVALDGKKLINIPATISHKTYDALQWLGTETVDANRRYQPTRPWWEKALPYVGLALGIFGVVLTVKMLMDGMAEVAASNVELARFAAQAAQALGKTSVAGGAP